MTIHLEPCPWDGAPATLEEVKSRVTSDEVQFSPGCTNPECIGYQLFALYPSRREAVDRWNRRAPRTLRDPIPLSDGVDILNSLVDSAKLMNVRGIAVSRKRKPVPLFSLKEAVSRGVNRVYSPIWASPFDHIKIDLYPDGSHGPWVHLYSPFNEVINGHDPVDLLWLGKPQGLIDENAKSFYAYTGPLPDSDEYKAEVADRNARWVAHSRRLARVSGS